MNGLQQTTTTYDNKFNKRLKGTLNPNFLNFTINKKNFYSRYVLVPFLNLLL